MLDNNNNQENENIPVSNGVIPNNVDTNAPQNVASNVDGTVVTEQVTPVVNNVSQPQSFTSANDLLGINNVPQKEENKNNNKIVIGVLIGIVAVVLILFLVKVLPGDKKENGKKDDVTTTTDSKVYEKNPGIDYYALVGDKSYFIETKDDLDTDYEKKAGDKVLGEYTCQTEICEVFDISGSMNNTSALIYDNNHYFIYDYKNKTTKHVDIPMQEYDYAYVVNYNDGVGIYLETYDDNDKTGFYDVETKKMLINMGEYDDIMYDENTLNGNAIILVIETSDGDVEKVYDIKKQSLVSDKVTGVISNGKTTYYINGNYDISQIYSDKIELLVDLKYGTDIFYLTDDGKLIFTSDFDSKFNIIENNKISYTSKEYDDIEAIGKNGIVVKTEDAIVVIDYSEKEVFKIADLTSDISIYGAKFRGDEVAVMTVDQTVKCEEFDKDTIIDKFSEGDIKSTYEDALASCKVKGFGYSAGYLYTYNFKNSKLDKVASLTKYDF